MKYSETTVTGAWVIEPDLIRDDRGFFARSFCAKEFKDRSLCDRWVQTSISFNRIKGTLRGMHYQAPPHAEIKLVSCPRGAIHDVILDLRSGSPSRHRWTSVELNESNCRMLYIPEGVAHGFQTLRDDTLVHYQISRAYDPGSARGVRWNDSAFGIRWPLPDPVMSERDRAFPDHRPGDEGR